MKRIFIVPVLLWAVGSASAASFDCAKAATSIEKGICSDQKLSAMDSSLAATYAAMKKAYPDYIAKNLVIDQRNWIRERDKRCRSGDVGCLSGEYDYRIRMLKMYRLADLSGLDFNGKDKVIRLKARFDGLDDRAGRDIPKYISEPYTKVSVLKQLITYPFEDGFAPYNTHDHPLKFTKGASTRKIVSCADYVKADKDGYRLSVEEPYRLVSFYLDSCEKKVRLLQSLQKPR